MVVPAEALEKAKQMLQEAKRPIFLHDDDCDGTTSFVICYQFCGHEGKSVPIKRSPMVSPEFCRSVQDYEADLVVILDKPRVSQEFFEQVRAPILWIDHHEPQTDLARRFGNIVYLNPRIWDDADNRPTSYWCYIITKTNLWLATVGVISDWHMPDFLPEFAQAYPGLVPEDKTVNDPVEDLYLNGPIATLIRVIQFNLKGMTADVKKSVLTLTRIETPQEILEQSTSRGKFLWKKYQKLADAYSQLLEQACKIVTGDILAYIYTDDTMTFTAELSNELHIRYPDKVILVGRHHEGRYKCSVRSAKLDLPGIINECIKGLDATGGGHLHAVGTSVADKDWEEFMSRFTRLVEERSK